MVGIPALGSLSIIIAFFSLVTKSQWSKIWLIACLPAATAFFIAGWICLYLVWVAIHSPKCFTHFVIGLWKDEHKRLNNEKKPRRIILIRHGESEGNTNTNIYQTVPDSKLELTEKGRMQAKAAGAKIKEIIKDETVRFVVSPYTRSIQTLGCIVEGGKFGTQNSIREDARIREQDWGNFQDPKQMEQIKEERRLFGAFYYRFPNGESGSDVYDRVTSFWSTLMREFDYGLENFVIVSHGITLRCFLMRYFRWTVEEFHLLWNLENCQIVVLEKQANGQYRLMHPLKRNPENLQGQDHIRSPCNHENEKKLVTVKDISRPQVTETPPRNIEKDPVLSVPLTHTLKCRKCLQTDLQQASS